MKRSASSLPSEADLGGRLPNFLIVGAQRSGTTTLAGYLMEHPEAFMHPRKELHFFDLHYEQGIDWYRAAFPRDKGPVVVGEATPNYMYIEAVPERIAKTLPGARLIALLREPVARAYSHYWRNVGLGRENLSFLDAIESEGDRLASGGLAMRLRFSYVGRGRYLEQLRAVRKYFPAAQVHVALFEDLRDKPAETYAGICRFLGIDDAIAPSDIGKYANAPVAFRSVSARRASRLLPKPLRTPIRKWNAKALAYPPLEPAVRHRVEEMFADDIAGLRDLLRRDLAEWG